MFYLFYKISKEILIINSYSSLLSGEVLENLHNIVQGPNVLMLLQQIK